MSRSHHGRHAIPDPITARHVQSMASLAACPLELAAIHLKTVAEPCLPPDRSGWPSRTSPTRDSMWRPCEALCAAKCSFVIPRLTFVIPLMEGRLAKRLRAATLVSTGAADKAQDPERAQLQTSWQALGQLAYISVSISAVQTHRYSSRATRRL